MNNKNMYIIIKREDAQKYLSNDEIKKLVGMIEKISDGRMEDNKHPSNTYYVCNTDEPYANAVHNVILGGEALKNSSSYRPRFLWHFICQVFSYKCFRR